MSIRKHNAKAGVWAIRLLSITLSVMLIVTMIPSSGIGRVYAEPKTNDAQGSPAFSQQMEVDGILVGVEAPDGLLPADAMLAVSEITDEELLAKAEEAVGEQREQGTTPDVSRVFDVKILDSQGNELQPAEGQGLITVSFSKAGDQEADTMVYQLLHEPSSEPDWIARKCDATWNPSTNMYEVDADSFSPFVLESMGQSLKDSKAAPLRGSGTEADLFSAYWDGERYVLPSGTYKMTEDFTAQGFIKERT